MGLSSSTKSTLQIALAVLLFVAAGLLLWQGVLGRYLGPGPLVPADMADVDPLVTEAVRESADVVRRNKSDLAGRMNHCMVLQANGMSDTARDCWLQVLSLDPEQARAWFLLAKIYERDGLMEEAIEAQVRAAEIEPYNPAIHWHLGLWLTDIGRFDEAAEAIQTAVDLEPTDEAAWFALTRYQLAHQQYEEAIGTIEAQSLLDGRNGAHARHLLAAAYRGLGRRQEAEALVAREENRAPTFPDPWTTEMLRRRTGHSYMSSVAARLVQTERYTDALQVLDRLRGLRSEDHRVAVLEAQCYLKLGQPERSVEILEEAVQRIPDNALLYTNLTLSVLASNQGNGDSSVDKALDYGEKAVALAPDSNQARLAWASSLLAVGRDDEAVEEFLAALEMDARDPVPFIQAAHKLITREDLTSAERLLEGVSSSADQRSSWWAGMVRIEIARGDVRSAQLAFERAVAAPDQDADSLSVLREQIRAVEPE